MIDAVAVTVDDLGRLLEHNEELDQPTANLVYDTLHELMRLTQPAGDPPQL